MVLGSLRLAHRGAPPEAILQAERGSASRGCGSQPQAREVRKPTAGHNDPAARSSLHDHRRQCRGRKRGPAAKKSPRWSAERRASPSAQGTQGASQAPGVPRHGTPAGCRCIRAPSGAPPPLVSGRMKEMLDTRAQRAAGTSNAVRRTAGCLTSLFEMHVSLKKQRGYSGRGWSRRDEPTRYSRL